MERWDGEPDRRVRFIVLPAVPDLNAHGHVSGRLALVKFVPGSTRAHIAQLRDGGTVVEHDPWSQDRHEGRWWVHETRLHVVVGAYHWVNEFSDSVGFHLGSESGPHGQQAISAALVLLPTDDPTFLQPVPGDGTVLFHHDGWEFRSLEGSRGAFAEVLEATRPGRFGEQKRAAKCFRPGLDRIVEREVAFLRRVGGKTGIIAVDQHLDLPDEPRFGLYAGAVVQLVELYETDLARHLRAEGATGSADVVRLAIRLAGAAVELHDYFHVLHNDIRPANVVGRPADVDWKLTDFNVARDFDPGAGRARMPGTALVCLSPALAAARAAAGRGEDWRPTSTPADDMWAIGLTLLQAATGTVFAADTPIPPPDALRLAKGCSPNVRSMLVGCLHADARQRWTAVQLREEATRVQTLFVDYGGTDIL